MSTSRPRRLRALTGAALTALGTLAAAASLPACNDKPPPRRPDPACNPPAEIDAPIIALSAGDTCPRPASAKDGRWDVAPVFPAAAGERLPASMARLCAYSWSGCGAPDRAALPLDGLAWAAADPPVVQPLAPAEAAAAGVVSAARARLARAADAPSPLPAASGATPVFVGVPDTSPAPPKNEGDIPLDAVAHGFDMAWITRFLACPNGSLRPCLARVRTDLALGRPGGRGARADLASSIVRLVRAWKERDSRSAPLILSVAAGWEPLAESALPWIKGPPTADTAAPSADTAAPAANTPSPAARAAAPAADKASPAADPDALPAPPAPEAGAGAPLSPGARAVLDALHYAACHGALVVAAAGNDPGYEDTPSGPMLPAAWERLPAPSEAACKAWFGDDAVKALAAPKTGYAPLVHAVGGVDDRDHPIPGSRARAMPRLVAPAALAAAYPEDPADAGYARLCAPGADAPSAFVCDRTAVRTGTSVAAAVTSAIAAVVWAHHPAWSGHDVMAALYAGGMSLGEKPDVLFSGKGRETIVRVSLCGALAASCKGAPRGTCPDRLTCTRPPAFARGPRPSPFVPVQPGTVPLAIDVAGAGFDPALVCPSCLFHTKQVQSSGCELAGKIPGALFETGRAARVHEPHLDLYDALGRRLGYVEPPGFRPQSWSAQDLGDQPVYTNAASCNGAARAVLRFTLCLDAACARSVPVLREVPIVE